MRSSSQRVLPAMAFAAGISLLSLAVRRDLRPAPRTAPAPQLTAATGERAPAARSLAPARWSALAMFAAALIVAGILLPSGVHVFRPSWVIHPDETGYLITSRQLADKGSFFIDDEWYSQAASHVPPGTTLVDGRIVPQKAYGGYLVYAAALKVDGDGWRHVGPVFALIGAAAVMFIVHAKTRSVAAGLAGGIIAMTASPVIMWGSGVAFADVIAVAAFLWGVVFTSWFVRRPSYWSAALAGACMGFATIVRYDFAVAAIIAAVVVGNAGYRGGSLRPTLTRAVPGIVVFGAFGVSLLVASNAFYGSPFTTGYSTGWQGSPEGVAGSFLAVDLVSLPEMLANYLLRVGAPCTALLAAGIAAKMWLRRFDAADGVLLGFAAFCIIYYLGRPGAYGSGDYWLISSYPRYILPVYLAGIVVGIEAIAASADRISLPLVLKTAAIGSVVVLAAALGTREAFTNPRGVEYVERLSAKHRAIAEVADSTVRPTVLLSDLNTKAVPNIYTITPHLAPPGERNTVADVKRQLRDGKHVLVVGDLRTHALYTGYIAALSDAGIVLVPRRCSVEVYEAYLPADAPPAVRPC